MSLSYFPLDGSDFRFTMGLRPLKHRSWLHEDKFYKKDLEEKKRLLGKYFDSVVAFQPETLDAQNEILDLVKSELSRKFPEFESSTPEDANELPIVTAARLIQEDLVLMQTRENRHTLTAACVCFPTGWNLQEKIGKDMMTIHHPVPGLNSHIGAPIDRFFENFKPGKKVERFNWGLYDCADLFQPGWFRDGLEIDPQLRVENVGQKVFFRVERQTLQRLSNGKDTLFTIRIFTNSLKEVVADKNRARSLLYALQTMPDAVKKYKSIDRYEKQIMNYLLNVAG
jgi:Haem-dependent oxidative N-demethylase, alpha subunit-like